MYEQMNKKIHEVETGICCSFMNKYKIPSASFKLIRIYNRKRMSRDAILNLAIKKYNRYIETKKTNKHMGTLGTWKGIIKFLSSCTYDDWLMVTKRLCELYNFVPQSCANKRLSSSGTAGGGKV